MAKSKLIEHNLKLLEEFAVTITKNKDYQTILNNRYDIIEKFIQNSDSYEEMQNGIFDLFDILDAEDYENLLTRMMFVSYLFGYNSSNGNKS